MKIETHLHPHRFKGKFEQLIDLHKKNGYHGIIVTEHFHKRMFDKMTFTEWLNPILELQTIASKRDFWIFPGAEVTIDRCDYLTYGLTFNEIETLIGLWDFRQYQKRVLDLGGCIIQAHPFRENRRGYACLVNPGVDGFEVVNTHHENHNDLAYALALTMGKLMTRGSDAHLLRHCCKTHIEISECRNPKALPNFIRLATIANKAYYACKIT